MNNKKKLWVVKIGSGLITSDGNGVNIEIVTLWVKQFIYLKEQNIDLIIVSSGSIAEGMKHVNYLRRPTKISELQALSAIGQMRLTKIYDDCFSKYQAQAAQVLLTHFDLHNSISLENAINTLKALLKHGVTPIINENDTVATEEIKFGDNDTLAAAVSIAMNADMLVLLTDQKGLYDKNPSIYANANFLPIVSAKDEKLTSYADTKGGKFGIGGMYTKVIAARNVAAHNCKTIIVNGKEENILQKIYNGSFEGTTILP